MNEEKASIVYALKPKPRSGVSLAGSNGYLAGGKKGDCCFTASRKVTVR